MEEVELTNLCVSRKPGQTVLVGKDITVTIVSIVGEKAKVRITAPRTTLITRGERFDGRAKELHEHTDGKR